MPPSQLVLLSALDILLYTARSYTSKLYADWEQGGTLESSLAFSVITGFAGALLTLLFTDALASPLSLSTLLCGAGAGAMLLLYNIAAIRAAETGPYAFQSILGMFGCVVVPLVFDVLVWGMSLSAPQCGGILLVLVSFVLLNSKEERPGTVRPGYYRWVALLFASNGAYSILMAAQQRLPGSGGRGTMVACVFLTMAVSALVCLRCRKGGAGKAALRLSRRGWAFALVNAACLTAAMNLLVLLLGHVSPSILYPVQNSAILILLVLLSAVHLHEPIRGRTRSGILLALAGIAVLGRWSI